MGKSFNRADEDTFKPVHRPRGRKIKNEDEFFVDSAALLPEDLQLFDLNRRSDRREPRR